MQPVPAQIPHADNSIDDVHLEGTFNALVEEAALQNFLKEIFRVLRPAGKIHVHSLVADRPLKGKPALPGPAALVDKVPLEHEVMRTIVGAGFVGASFTKLGATPCFTAECVEMREMRLVAQKPVPAELFPVARTVLYKGPLSQVVDDLGTVFVRGERVAVNSQQWDLLRQGPAAEQFAFFDGMPAKPAACCG